MNKTTHHRTHHRNSYDLHKDVEKLKAALSDTTDDIKGRANQLFTDSYAGIRERRVQAQENVANYVSEKPFKSLGIALLSGIVIGFLLRK